MDTRKLIAVIAAAGTVVIVVLLVCVLALLQMLGALSQDTLINGGVGDDCLDPGSVAYGSTYDGADKFFTPEENAARIYAQATGLGLGQVGALAGITAALQESSLKNGGRGDFVQTGKLAGTMTESRGMFQQKAAWVTPGLAWSGMKWEPQMSESHFADVNPITGDPDPWNPWKGVKWAVKDPRMNHAQSTNMFLLGPNYNPRAGLEDASVYKANATKAAADVSDTDIAAMVQKVQAAGTDRALQMVPKARQYLTDILAGAVTVPPFEPPTADVARRATTLRTKAALKTVTPTATAIDTTTVPGDGLTMVGDSVMQGMLTYNKVPDQLFNGPVVTLAQRSMTLDDVLHHPGVKTVNRTKANLPQWRTAIATGPSRILVELGTNNSAANTVDGIAEFMALAGPSREVYWFSQHYLPSKDFDDALITATSMFPNLHIVDVSTLVKDFTQMHPDAATSRAFYDKAITQMSNQMDVPAQLVSVVCAGAAENAFNDTIEPTGDAQRAAIMWARLHLSKVTGGWYTYGVNTDPNLDSGDYNCSTYTSAAYRAATGDAIQLVGLSDAQWADTTHIQLIPASMAQPGDLFFEHNSSSGSKLSGHVGLIESLAGTGTILHAANGTDGIVRGSLKDRMSGDAYWLSLKDPTNPSRGADNIVYTQNWNEAYVGRVIT